MTCKDCIHYKMCDFPSITNDITIAKSCEDFKNKADYAEVKHGKWKRRGQEIYCSVCKNESAFNPFGASKFSDYCPHCGAKMDL